MFPSVVQHHRGMEAEVRQCSTARAEGDQVRIRSFALLLAAVCQDKRDGKTQVAQARADGQRQISAVVRVYVGRRDAERISRETADPPGGA